MIGAKEIKQRAIISALEKYEPEINQISKAILEAADRGEFMLYYDPKNLKRVRRQDWTAILNTFDNAGYKTGIKDGKLLISWFHDLSEINLLETYKEYE